MGTQTGEVEEEGWQWWMDGWMDVGLLTQPSAVTLSSPLSFALFRSLL